MYNLAIAFGIGTVLFLVGALTTQTWIAGFIPGVLALIIAYIMLARRTGQKLQAIMETAMQDFQAGKIEKGRKRLEGAFALGKWQFLVEAQLHAQLGGIDYMQGRFKEARPHLEKAWSRHWIAQAMLATIEFREKNADAALKRMDKLAGPGGKDPVYWALYAYFALESGKRDRALKILTEGLKKNDSSEALKGMLDTIRNKKKLKMKAFAPSWYQFFPEQVPRSMRMQSANRRPGGSGYSFPQPRR